MTSSRPSRSRTGFSTQAKTRADFDPRSVSERLEKSVQTDGRGLGEVSSEFPSLPKSFVDMGQIDELATSVSSAAPSNLASKAAASSTPTPTSLPQSVASTTDAMDSQSQIRNAHDDDGSSCHCRCHRRRSYRSRRKHRQDKHSSKPGPEHHHRSITLAGRIEPKARNSETHCVQRLEPAEKDFHHEAEFHCSPSTKLRQRSSRSSRSARSASAAVAAALPSKATTLPPNNSKVLLDSTTLSTPASAPIKPQKQTPASTPARSITRNSAQFTSPTSLPGCKTIETHRPHSAIYGSPVAVQDQNKETRELLSSGQTSSKRALPPPLDPSLRTDTHIPSFTIPRQNTSAGGTIYPTEHVMQAITQTMIGMFMSMYTRLPRRLEGMARSMTRTSVELVNNVNVDASTSISKLPAEQDICAEQSIPQPNKWLDRWHVRFVWMDPHTLTLHWSASSRHTSSIQKSAEVDTGRFKTAHLLDVKEEIVYNVHGPSGETSRLPHPRRQASLGGGMFPDESLSLHDRSLILVVDSGKSSISSLGGRELRLNAPSAEAHATWMEALRFLLNRERLQQRQILDLPPLELPVPPLGGPAPELTLPEFHLAHPSQHTPRTPQVAPAKLHVHPPLSASAAMNKKLAATTPTTTTAALSPRSACSPKSKRDSAELERGHSSRRWRLLWPRAPPRASPHHSSARSISSLGSSGRNSRCTTHDSSMFRFKALSPPAWLRTLTGGLDQNHEGPSNLQNHPGAQDVQDLQESQSEVQDLVSSRPVAVPTARRQSDGDDVRHFEGVVADIFAPRPQPMSAEAMIEEDEGGCSYRNELDNVRVCCDGKHDIGCLAHNHTHSRSLSDRRARGFLNDYLGHPVDGLKHGLKGDRQGEKSSARPDGEDRENQKGHHSHHFLGQDRYRSTFSLKLAPDQRNYSSQRTWAPFPRDPKHRPGTPECPGSTESPNFQRSTHSPVSRTTLSPRTPNSQRDIRVRDSASRPTSMVRSLSPSLAQRPSTSAI